MVVGVNENYIGGAERGAFISTLPIVQAWARALGLRLDLLHGREMTAGKLMRILARVAPETPIKIEIDADDVLCVEVDDRSILGWVLARTSGPRLRTQSR